MGHEGRGIRKVHLTFISVERESPPRKAVASVPFSHTLLGLKVTASLFTLIGAAADRG